MRAWPANTLGTLLTPVLLLTMVLLLTLLGGCATGPKFGDVEGLIPALAANAGRVYFYRDGSPFGSALQPDVLLNGEKIGQAIPGGFFYVDRPPGEYIVTCSTEATSRLTLHLSAGARLYVRARSSMGLVVGRVDLELEDEGEAMKTLESSSYTGGVLSAPGPAR